MTVPVGASEWLACCEQEYLDTFIAAGGAAIKFLVPMDEGVGDRLIADVSRAATRGRYLLLEADAADVKVHMLDQVCFCLAAQVSWTALARERLFALAEDDGYKVDRAMPEPVEIIVAECNDLDASFVRGQLRRMVQNSVFKDISMTRDFRVAMSHLCLAELTGGEQSAITTAAITDWITGRNKAITAVKPYEIRTRIVRTNARVFLESLFAWVKRCGRAGSVVILDITRLAVSPNPRDDRHFYSKPALLDAYEVLRQFIDGTDRLEGCLLLVVASEEFLDMQPQTRGMGAYEALMFRVYDEVRDKLLPNPMASLVRISDV